MNQTQKDFVKFWTKLLLVLTFTITFLVGMFMGNKFCLIFVSLFCLAIMVYAFIIWIAERVYLWRIMGVLTPSEWEIAKWYKFSLLNGGPNDIISQLAQEKIPCLAHIAIFEKIANQVKIPKILLDKSNEP